MAGEEPYPFSPPVLLLAIFAIAFGIIVPATFPRSTIFIVITGASIYLLNTTTGNVIYDFPLAVWYVCILYTASDYILLSNPQRELRLVGQASTMESSPLELRIRWGFRLWSSIRGVGWEHEPVGIYLPVLPKGTSKTAFFITRARNMAVYTLMGDIATIYNRQCPTFQKDGVSFADRPWEWKFVDMFFWLLATNATACMLHTSVSMVSVLAGLSLPEDWKHPFGRWTDAYTLRKFWGRVWQQFMRRFFVVHGKFVTRRVLKLKPGTNASSYVQLYIAFLMSGLMHWPADYTLSLDWTKTGSMPFFLVQAVAITCEDAVIAAAKKLGITSSLPARLLGYAWVACWFAATLPGWWDPMNRGGFADMMNFDHSAVLWVWEGQYKY